MATAKRRTRSRGEGGDEGEHGGQGHNVAKFDGEVLDKYLDEIKAAEDRMAKRMADASKKNQGDRKLIKERTKELVESGYESKVLAAVRRKAKLEFQAENVASTLDEEQAETYEQMAAALGAFRETPLGRAALKRRAQEDE